MRNFHRRVAGLKTLLNSLFAALIAFVLLFGAIRYMIAEIWGAGQSFLSLLWEVLPAVFALLFAWLFTSLILKRRIFSPLKEFQETVHGLSGELSEGKLPGRTVTSRELQEVRDELCRQGDELAKFMRYTQCKLSEEVSARERAEIARRIYSETVQDSLKEAGAGYRLDGAVFRSGAGYEFLDAFPLGENTVFFALGDIWGQGLSAALFLSRLKSTLRAGVLSGKLLAEVMADLNAALYRDNPEGNGASLFAGVFNAAARELHFVNMGGFAPIALGSPGFLHLRTGSPLGLYESVTVFEESLLLAPGQGLVFCSEGAMLAAGEREHAFGYRRILEVSNLLAREENAAEKILDAVNVRAREGCGAAALVFRCEGSGGAEAPLYAGLFDRRGG